MVKQSENPLFGKNIPPPPPAASSPARRLEETDRVVVSRQSYVAPETEEEGKERATIELSLYLRSSQDDKLEDLRRAYKRRTGRKISANEVMRRLIDQATLEMLLLSQDSM